MEIFKEIEPLRAFLKEKRMAGISIGLVPTMGALHKGHLSLIDSSKAENDLTVATIYVNPTQFNNVEDLDKYPRTQEADIKLLEQNRCDILFMPPNSEMYAQNRDFGIDFGLLDKVLEGKFRPGHFSGVAIVVSKLFNIVMPDKAYFGQKDYQQFKIIDRLKDELKFSVTLRSLPIIREESGLAMSSRNQRLTETDQKKALLLYKSLKLAKSKILEGHDFPSLHQQIEKQFKDEPNVKLEYFELVHKDTLQPYRKSDGVENGILLVAAFINEIRLIDNMFLVDE